MHEEGVVNQVSGRVFNVDAWRLLTQSSTRNTSLLLDDFSCRHSVLVHATTKNGGGLRRHGSASRAGVRPRWISVRQIVEDRNYMFNILLA